MLSGKWLVQILVHYSVKTKDIQRVSTADSGVWHKIVIVGASKVQNRHNSLLCTDRTFRQGLSNLRVGYLKGTCTSKKKYLVKRYIKILEAAF